MSKIFDGDSDSDFEVKTNNEYAKNYDTWRKKEEINKIKTKYGEENLNLDEGSSSSSSEDDEDGVELTEKVERDFFKTLSCLKKKDPRIYDENVKFFDEKVEVIKKEKKKKEQPMYLKDYERKLILEKGGQLSDDEENDDEDPRARSPTYIEEQKKIKENLVKALNDVDEGEDETWGGLFKERAKTKEENAKEEAEYKEWLSGQKIQLEDKQVESDLKPLKDFWSNPKLDKGEQFLRDYILQKKFLEKDDDNYIPTYDEVIHDSDESLSDDGDAIERQEEFEHKYNFRFEDPDQDFIKRYPRTMENSLRRKDDKRKVKRAETKERKQKEKEEKMKDIKKLQELKKKEIEEKIEKLKEVTGNTELGFEDEDIDGDFDPDDHDKRMQALFNEEFYEGQEEQKPEFPDLDEELEIERWDRYEGSKNDDEDYNAPHCEDEEFNMDCEYDPSASTQKDLVEASKGKRKKKKKSKFAEVLSKPKPKFDPNDTTYEKYLDEYYKLDCEDLIGDLPCRFKYRKVIPNDFGLSTEEILFAKDRELNRWCSLKKAVQIRPDHVEKYEQIAFSKKAQNVNLKKKLLPSLFEEEKTDNQNEDSGTSMADESKSKKEDASHSKGGTSTLEEEKKDSTNTTAKQNIKATKKKKKNQNHSSNQEISSENKKEIVEVKSIGKSEKINGEIEKKEPTLSKKKKKKKNKKKQPTENNNLEVNSGSGENKRKRKNSEKIDKGPKKKFKKNKSNADIGISDARLQAYGIKPKKFKNKLKYGKKS